MPDLAFDLRHLKYAMLVAKYGSFRRAADATNIPQSTITRRIQLLEAHLGVTLFERSRTGTRPTHSGERFIREATFGAEHLSRAVSDLRQIRSESSGVLRVGIGGPLAGFLADLFCRFRRKYRDIDVLIEEGGSQSIAAAVQNGKLDAAFACGSRQLAGCQTRPLWSERIFLAVPTWHSSASTRSINLEDVREEVFIVRAHGPGPEVEDYLVRQLSGPSFRPRIIAHNVGGENLLNMVARGFGVTLASESALGTCYSGVRFVPLRNIEDVVEFSILSRITNENPALRTLLELCSAAALASDIQSSV